MTRIVFIGSVVFSSRYVLLDTDAKIIREGLREGLFTHIVVKHYSPKSDFIKLYPCHYHDKPIQSLMYIYPALPVTFSKPLSNLVDYAQAAILVKLKLSPSLYKFSRQ